MTAETLPRQLLDLSPGQLDELLCRADPGVWAERKRGFRNAPFHWEWYDMVATERRACCVAPREHAKSEVFTVNATAWRSIYEPGVWTYVFSYSLEQVEKIKERIDLAIEEVDPAMTFRMKTRTKHESVYTNGSRLTVASAGKAVRSAHPDVVIGDDVLEEELSRSALHRERISNWWLGTVANMSHPGTTRTLPDGRKVRMPATRVFLVGTPFHQSDLLMSMRDNPLYTFRRYAAEFDDTDLVDGWAVEVGKR